MVEQSLETLSAEELNADFCKLFDLLPNDLPGSFYEANGCYESDLKDRDNSDWKLRFSMKLDGLLRVSSITKSGQQYFRSKLNQHYVYGLREVPSSVMFRKILNFVKESKTGIFQKKTGRTIEEASFMEHQTCLDLVDIDLKNGLVSHHDYSDIALAIGKKFSEDWKREFKVAYGEELSLPIPQ